MRHPRAEDRLEAFLQRSVRTPDLRRSATDSGIQDKCKKRQTQQRDDAPDQGLRHVAYDVMCFFGSQR